MAIDAGSTVADNFFWEAVMVLRFAIPLTDGVLASHIHRCREFMLIDVRDGKIIAQETHVPPSHDADKLIKWFEDMDANVLLAAGIPHKYLDVFNLSGISIITGVCAGEPVDLVNRFLNDSTNFERDYSLTE